MNEASTLRKAAILISMLSDQQADAILEQMTDDEAARVRLAVMDLDDIDPAEQQEVMQSFMNRPTASDTPEGSASSAVQVEVNSNTSSQLAEADDSGVELQLSSQAATITDTPSDATESAADDQASDDRFAFLQGIDVETLEVHLRSEHPQTIAVVMTLLSSDQAAAVSTRLPAATQVDVLARVARTSETSPEAIAAVAESLQGLIANEPAPISQDSIGVQTVASILEAVNESQRDILLENVLQRNQELAEVLGVPADDYSDNRTLPSAGSSNESTFEYAIEFDDLEQMAGEDLALVFREAGPELMLLALAGARRTFVDRLLTLVPRRFGRALQKRFEDLGPTRLDDLRIAQQQVAQLTAQLIQQGKVTAPQRKRFAVSA